MDVHGYDMYIYVPNELEYLFRLRKTIRSQGNSQLLSWYGFMEDLTFSVWNLPWGRTNS